MIHPFSSGSYVSQNSRVKLFVGREGDDRGVLGILYFSCVQAETEQKASSLLAYIRKSC